MAHASPRKRRERRLKRQMTLLERQFTLAQRIEMLERSLAQAQQQGSSAVLLLLAILAQKGGDIEITTGTLDQVKANIANLGWNVRPNPNDKTACLVSLTEGKETE